MILNSPGTIRWYETADEQHRLKPYAYGQRAPLLIGRNQFPPFQLVIPVDYLPASSFKIISRATGVESERFTMMFFGGLQTVTFPGFKVIKYPAHTLIAGGLFDEGVYYARMTNGEQVWESEEFCMTSQEDLWRIEYCHGEDFQLAGTGVIDYGNSFINYFLVNTYIGKPIYSYEEQVSRRDGFNFPLQQIRYKSHVFELVLPEETIDAMSLIPLHDTVRIRRGDTVYEVDEILMEVNWQEQGDLAVVEFEFRTDTVVVINGRGVGVADDCNTAEGECFEIAQTAVALIYEGTPEWDEEYYTTPGGVQVPFENLDFVVVYERITGNMVLYQYSGGHFVEYPTSPGQYFYETNTGQYFYDDNTDSLLWAHIDNLVGDLLTGGAIPISVVEAYALLAGGGEVLIGVAPSDEFSESGMTVETPDGMIAVSIRVSTAICPHYYDSGWFYLDPFDTLVCQGEYASDAEAIADGVEESEYYCLTIDNVYGMPKATVRRLPPFVGYASDTAAEESVGADVLWVTSSDNFFGEPEGTVRMVPGLTPVYTSDSQAGVGGVGVGEFYIWNPGGSGFISGLIKKRES